MYNNEAGCTATPPEGESEPFKKQVLAAKNNDAETAAQAYPQQRSAFPCIEQPSRVTFNSKNGWYLCGIRGGRVAARQQKRDEFVLKYTNREQGIVEIVHYKSGDRLAVVTEDTTVGDSADHGNNCKVCLVGMDEDEGCNAEAQELSSVTAPASAKLDTDDTNWCFVRGPSEDGCISERVMIKSLKTGENLAANHQGKIILVGDIAESAASSTQDTDTSMWWNIDCATGELCFLANANKSVGVQRSSSASTTAEASPREEGDHPQTSTVVRCDMTGSLSLTANWKGWEVFRFTEASHGYVKISSWMHSQWFLCSTPDGTVSTCSHTETVEGSGQRCALWAISSADHEHSPSSLYGVTLRSKEFNRYLIVQNGMLKTFDPTAVADYDMKSDRQESDGILQDQQSWRHSLHRIGGSLSERFNKSTNVHDQIPQHETMVWQLEAAHLQSYYFAVTNETKPTLSIGPLPYATPNLRQSDKIRLVRRHGFDTFQLLADDQDQHVACSTDGSISLTETDGPETEWILEKPEAGTGTAFRSQIHHLYLSIPTSSSSEEEVTDPPELSKGLPALFRRRPVQDSALLHGSQYPHYWQLEPCMPRAVSSEKIATFALGTSIAVGTTIAMPFALAGAGAVLGAVGAEAGILFNVIAAGLTGAEALASVGAIGATAYIVFRPEENSLTDNHSEDAGDKAEMSWSKRPFSSWRSW